MHQNNTQFLFCFVSVVFLIFNILISISSSAVVLVDEQYARCAPLGNSTCGPSLEIKYPFWDSSRPDYCGHPSFGLKCQADYLTIKIENQTYNVLNINYDSNVFTISKAQFSQAACPATESELKNSTLDLTLFSFTSKTQNATLFYDCEQEADSTAIFSFSCPQSVGSGYGGTTTTSGFSSSFNYLAVDEKWEDVLTPLCSININIPVFKTAVTDLENGRSTMNNVVSGGFELKWVIDESQCKDCSGTGGRCGYNQTLGQPICLCQNGASTTTCAQLDDLQGTALTSPDQKLQSKKNIVIGVGVAAGASSLILLSILGVIYQRRYRKKKSSLRSVPRDNWPGTFSTTLDANASTYFGVQVLSYTMLEEATDYFNPAKEIGAGGFGTVYYGKLQDGREVAIKRLYENNNKRAAQFLNEVEILANLRHKNLVNLYGCTSRQSRELLLVYEYVPNGTVADHLHGKNAKLGLLQWSRRLGIATETACALLYLHDSDIIHRDVKTQNVLLDKDFSVKVADFGLSRLFPLDVTHVSTAPQGTPGYVDPEYHQCYQLTEKSDVYSFGVLLAELLSSKPAVDITRHRADINLANMLISKIQIDALDEFVDPTLEFQSDFELKKEITAVAELAYQCLQSTREMRPSMEQVLERLYNIQDHEHKIERAEVVDVPADDVFMLKGDDYSPASSSMDDNSVRRLNPHASV